MSLMDGARGRARCERTGRRTAAAPDDHAGDHTLELLPAAKPARPAAPAPYRPFPTEALPQPVRSFVEQAAGAIGCDPSFLALPALSACASLIGNTRVIRLKRGWSEPCVLWACLVGDSGSLKSPALYAAVAPVYRMQDELRADHRDELKRYEQTKATYDQRRRRSGDSSRPPDERAPDRPRMKRVIVSDTTVEKLAEVLEDNPHGVLLARDELAGWFGSFTKYKGRAGGSDLPNWLEMHRAGPVMVDRKTGDRPSLFVPRAAVSVCGGIQPGTLAHCFTAEHLEAGLGARVLLAMPPRTRKEWTEREVHPDVTAAYEAALRELADLSFDVNNRGEREPFALRMTPEAKELWVGWYNAWSNRQAAAEGATAAALAKLEGGAGRLALLHALVSGVGSGADDCEPVGAESMSAGIALARWFAAEAERVYEALAESDDRRTTRRLIEFIRANDGKTTARRLHLSNKSRWPDADAAEAALDDLAKAGLGNWVDAQPGPKGGRPTRALVLKPDTTCYETYETPDGDEGEDARAGEQDATKPATEPPTTGEKPLENGGSVGFVACSTQDAAPAHKGDGDAPQPEAPKASGEVLKHGPDEGPEPRRHGYDDRANPSRSRDGEAK